jgi:hypothetical protein
VQQAPDLGSLIEPSHVDLPPGVTFGDLLPFLDQAFQSEAQQSGVVEHERGVAAHGIARAIDLLGQKYHLVVTNVPFLTRVKQGDTLGEFLDETYPLSSTDLATAFLERCLRFCRQGGAIALVTPQNWHFLGSYKRLRKRLLREETWNFVVKLGPAAFRGMNWWAANNQLCILTAGPLVYAHPFPGFDVSDTKNLNQKAEWLRSRELKWTTQEDEFNNPDHRITLECGQHGPLLQEYAYAHHGLTTGDIPRMSRFFWEMASPSQDWIRFASSVDETCLFGGRRELLYWCNGSGPIDDIPGARKDGQGAWGKAGVLVRQMRHLPVTLYSGDAFDSNNAAVIPNNPQHLPAIWAFCQSPDFHREVRRIDQQVKVTNATLVKLPFDLAYWQAVAEANGPVPEPYSNDPTQWLFKGNVTAADVLHQLQVAMARLLGYRWPDQPVDKLDQLAESAGLVCLPAIGADKAAAERLRELLAAAYGTEWSAARQESLLSAVGFGGKTLHEWLRDGFFDQHCKLFHNQPFLWHIWDGRKDGFSAIVNYHTFDRRALETLIHHYLGWWLKKQEEAVKKGESGADGRYADALDLQKRFKLVLEGEEPYDLFVRWKPLEEQPIGWEPDLNDGVRINIRPFVTADVLRKKPKLILYAAKSGTSSKV